MRRYIPISSVETCDALSAALWALSRPASVRDDADGTTRLFGQRTMADGSVWLCVDTEFEIPVHAEAELGGIAGILQPWIDDGLLPADTITQLEDLIESKKGDRLVVYDVFPQLFKDQSKTQTELESAGLWPATNL